MTEERSTQGQEAVSITTVTRDEKCMCRKDESRRKSESKMVKTKIFLSLLALIPTMALAEEKIRLETPISGNIGCKYVDMVHKANVEIRRKSIVSWDGKCAEGYLSGNGILQIQQPDGKKQIFKGTYQNGLEDGVLEMTIEEPSKKVKIQGIWKSGVLLNGTV